MNTYEYIVKAKDGSGIATGTIKAPSYHNVKKVLDKLFNPKDNTVIVKEPDALNQSKRDMLTLRY